MISTSSMRTAQLAPVGRTLSGRVHARNAVVTRASSQGGFVEGLINNLTVAIQSSPLAEGKKALAVAQAGSYDVAAVSASVDKYIADNTVMIFSFSTCPFCKNAKKLLDDMNVQYKAIELNEMDGGMAIRAELAKKTGRYVSFVSQMSRWSRSM